VTPPQPLHAFSWERERRIAAGYASRRLLRGPDAAEPDEFATVWANMARGFHLGELRDLPPLESAFDDWLRELAEPPATPPGIPWQPTAARHGVDTKEAP